MSASALTPRAARLPSVVAVAAACFAALVLPGTTAPLLVPLALAGGLVLVRVGVQRVGALGLVALVTLLENPGERPGSTGWAGFLGPLGSLVFDNLNSLTGVEALRFSVLHLLIATLALAVALAPQPQVAEVHPLAVLLLVALGGLIFEELWGLLHGGDFRNSLYQMQHLTAAPVLALCFTRALDTRRDLRLLGALLLAAAFLKLALGAYFYEVICRPQQFRPPYTNTHSDSVLFVVALVIAGAFAFNRRTAGAFAFAALAMPALAYAMYLNNRRVAWLELGCAAALLFFAAPRSELKALLTRALLASLPILAIYVAAGWSSNSGIFRPVAMLRSVVDSDEDRSSEMRDIENFNLIMTLSPNPLVGTGFGREYDEVVRSDDISMIFPQYRFVPHNSVLGLWAFAGLLGFSCVWAPLVVALYLALRVVRLAPGSIERTAAMASATAIVAYIFQGYGDMGLQSWLATLLLALGVAVSSQLAARAGAFPAEARLFGRFARRGT